MNRIFGGIFRNLLFESIFWGFLSVAKNYLGRFEIPNSADPCLLICQLHPLGYFITKLMHVLFHSRVERCHYHNDFWLQCVSLVSAHEGKGRIYVIYTDSHQCSIVRYDILNAKANICSWCL